MSDQMPDLDGLFENGYKRRDALPSSSDHRVAEIRAILANLDAWEEAPADDLLVSATLARIDRHDRDLAPVDAPVRLRAASFRMPDLITIAAVTLIGISILWPLLSHLRQRSHELRCADNLRLIGEGFARYAGDHAGAMPAAAAGLGGGLGVFSSAMSLDPLVAGGYCEHGHLHCPGHSGEEQITLSRQWFAPGSSLRPWSEIGSSSVLVGDRNPLVDAFAGGEVRPALTISVNHGGRGQNILMGDGTVLWLQFPVLSGDDNIWLPAGFEVLDRRAFPSPLRDSFLVH